MVGHGTIEPEVKFVDVARMDWYVGDTVLQIGVNGRRQERNRHQNRNPSRACRVMVLEQLGKVEVGLVV